MSFGPLLVEIWRVEVWWWWSLEFWGFAFLPHFGASRFYLTSVLHFSASLFTPHFSCLTFLPHFPCQVQVQVRVQTDTGKGYRYPFTTPHSKSFHIISFSRSVALKSKSYRGVKVSLKCHRWAKELPLSQSVIEVSLLSQRVTNFITRLQPLVSLIVTSDGLRVLKRK